MPTDILNLGLILSLNGNKYKFSFNDKINETSNTQYDVGASLDKEIGRGKVDFAALANFIENYSAPGFKGFQKNGWEAHLLAGYSFTNGVAMLGYINSDGLTAKPGEKWDPTSPAFGGGLTLLLAKPDKVQKVLDDYFKAKQASLYEMHANNFSEIKKETDFLLTHIPEEYLRLWLDLEGHGKSGRMQIGAAGNPLPYVQPFIVYTAEKDLNGKRRTEFRIGGAYLF